MESAIHIWLENLTVRDYYGGIRIDRNMLRICMLEEQGVNFTKICLSQNIVQKVAFRNTELNILIALKLLVFYCGVPIRLSRKDAVPYI
jgi:hypothetical protein